MSDRIVVMQLFCGNPIGLKEQYVSQRTNQNFAGRNLSISFESGSLQYFLAKKLIDAFYL